MLLRASSEAIGEDAKLDGAVGVGDGAAPHGGVLLAYAEAAARGSEELPQARQAVLAALGEAGFVLAAATVGIFSGLVRVADSIGIPLDERTRQTSGALREDLGLNAFSGARNTDLDRPEEETGIEDFFPS